MTAEICVNLKMQQISIQMKKKRDWMWRHILTPSVDVTSQLLVTLPSSPWPNRFPQSDTVSIV